MEALLTVILVSGQLQLRTPFSRPEGFRLQERPLYVFLHPRKWPAPVTDTFLRFPRVSAYKSFLRMYFYIAVSGQLQLRTPFSRPEGVRLQERPLYVFLHPRKRPAPVTDTFLRFPRVAAYESFHCMYFYIPVSGQLQLRTPFLRANSRGCSLTRASIVPTNVTLIFDACFLLNGVSNITNV